MANQGLSQEVLSILNPQLPSSLADGELAVRRQMLQALAYSHLGRSSEADQSLRQAQQMCELTNCAAMGEVERIDGAVQAERNNSEQAEAAFRRSLQIARQQDDRFLEASDLLNLGVVAIGKEHFDQSVDWSRQANEVAQQLGAGLTEEKALGNMGWAYYKMGDFDKSLNFYLAAARRSHELGAVIDEVEWLNDQGLVYFQTAQFPLAEKYYRQSLDLARASQNQVQIINALTALAFVSTKTRNIDDANRYSSEAQHLSRQTNDRPDELYALLAQAQVEVQGKDDKHAEQLFRIVAGDPKSDTSLRWEAQDDLAKLYEATTRPAAAEQQFRQSLSTLEAARSSLHREEFRLPFLANGAHLYDDYVLFLLRQGKTSQALEAADFSRAQTLSEGLGLLTDQSRFHPAAMNAQQVARKLGGTILFYWLGDSESYLWAVTPNQTKLFSLPARAKIDDLVQRYRKVLVGPLDARATDNPDGLQLYNILVGPAEKLISPNSRVVIIPDGSLNNLNFETLLAPQPTPHYWIEDVSISDANSLRMLAASRPAAKAPRSLLLVGNAVLANKRYPELPNAGQEMISIENHFDPRARQVLAREQATSAAYRDSQPEQFSYIHFVAHGMASELSPLDSAIILSKSSSDDSFKLYARDIIEHPLHAELVTISSCYSEGSRDYAGEGLVGLSWAFLRAGAHNVIGALWEVSDTSTPQLMDHFYAGIQKGERPEAALRNAKLAMLHSDGVYRKPFYWAPFQLYVGF